MNINPAHLHLIVNHLPIVGSLIAFFMLAFALVFKKQELLKAVLGLLVLLGVASGAAYLSGEPAEELLESRPGFEERYVEEHEEMAKLALIASLATGVLAMGALVVFRKGVKFGFVWVILIATGITSFLMGMTGNLGGEISHPEIRQEKPAP